MVTSINPNIFIYTEKDISAELRSGGLNTANMRKFIGSYASLIRTQTETPGAIESLTVRINGIDVRLDGIDIRLNDIDVRIDSVETRLDEIESVAYMALLT